MKVVSAVLTSSRSAVISFAVPGPTVMWVSLSSEVRKAAASLHNSELWADGVGEAAAGEEVAPGEVPPDPHPATTSARPHPATAAFHLAGLTGLITLTGSHTAGSRASFSPGGLPVNLGTPAPRV